jgi:hypothetical protein
MENGCDHPPTNHTNFLRRGCPVFDNRHQQAQILLVGEKGNKLLNYFASQISLLFKGGEHV